MAIIVKENNILKERMYINLLSSKAKCYIIPKSSYYVKQAMVAFKYGSNDINFSFPKKNEVFKSPLGTAHFIEHKLFEKEKNNVFNDFSKNGAAANAFTDFNKTAYYFSCEDNFDKNFDLLLDFVQEPYFADKTVEKEKEIISSEIKMYQDDHSWIVFFNMLNAMYEKHSVKNYIAGDVKSIKDIDADLLYKCYNAFYTPENMVIVCSGSISFEKIFEKLENKVKEKKEQFGFSVFEDEPNKIVKKYIESKMDISKPLFNIGFKHEFSNESNGVKKIYGIKLLLDILFGEGSRFYENLYDNGFVSEEFALQYMSGKGYSFSSILGSSENPKEIFYMISEEINKKKEQGIPLEDFNRIKNKHTGRFIRGFNSVDAICLSQLELSINNSDLFEAFEAINTISKDTLEKILSEDFNTENMVLSVINKL